MSLSTANSVTWFLYVWSAYWLLEPSPLHFITSLLNYTNSYVTHLPFSEWACLVSKVWTLLGLEKLNILVYTCNWP